MFYQLAILCCAAATVLSAPTDVVPLEKQQPTVIPIISQSEELEPNGTYKYSYETGNGIKREEISYDKIVPRLEGRSGDSNEGGESNESDEIHVQQGSYSYTAPDGTVITLRYIADENGFQAFGDHLPRAPAPVQLSSSSAEKSGRALKAADSAEAASAPTSTAKSEPEQEPVQSAQPAQEPQPETTPAVDSTSAKVSAAPEQPVPTEALNQSSTTVAVVPSTAAADQSSTEALADQSTTLAADQSTTVAAEQPLTAAAEESSTVAAEQPAPMVSAEEPAPANSAEEPTPNGAVEEAAPIIAAEPTRSSAESNSVEPADQPVSAPAEQSATTISAQSSQDAAATTVSA